MDEYVVGSTLETDTVWMGGRPSQVQRGMGHAVAAEAVQPGEDASRALCRAMTTVHDPSQAFRTEPSLAYVACPMCVMAMRRR